MKTITVFLPNLKGGGAEKVFVNLSHQFLAKGFNLDLVLLEAKGELLDELPEAVNIVDLHCTSIRQSLIPLRNYIKETRPDVLIAVMWPLTIIAYLATSILSGKLPKLIFSDHNIFSNSFRKESPFRKFLIKRSIQIIYPKAFQRLAVSSGLSMDIITFSNLSVNTPFKVIHNPVFFPASDSAHSLAANKTAQFRVLCVGSFKEVKDHFTLLKAFNILRESIDVELVLLGDGELREDLEQTVQALGLSKYVLLPGFALHTRSWYLSSDLFVLSSKSEGFGNVIVEALHCGLPVVSTDCPTGPREILGDNEFGSLVPVGDAQALADAMLESLKTEHDIEKLKARAADFSVEKIARQYLEVMFPEEKGAETGASNA